MNYIVAGQRIVTADEFIEAAAGFGPELELDITADLTEGGLAARAALTDFLTDVAVESEIDALDVAFYTSLKRRLPRELRSRKAQPVTKVVAELEAADDALDYEDHEITADWTSADFDSYEVLAMLGTADPAAAVARAREPRTERRAIRAALRIVRSEVSAEVAA